MNVNNMYEYSNDCIILFCRPQSRSRVRSSTATASGIAYLSVAYCALRGWRRYIFSEVLTFLNIVRSWPPLAVSMKVNVDNNVTMRVYSTRF